MTAPTERPENTVDPKLLEILVCPMTKGPLEFDAAKQELISRSAKLAYPIRDGIPIMLPEEARKIDCRCICHPAYRAVLASRPSPVASSTLALRKPKSPSARSTPS